MALLRRGLHLISLSVLDWFPFYLLTLKDKQKGKEMTDQPTPEKIKAFLDDLARISLRHGVRLTQSQDGMQLVEETCHGYYICGGELAVVECEVERKKIGGWPWPISIDPTQLSNHERMKIMGI